MVTRPQRKTGHTLFSPETQKSGTAILCHLSEWVGAVGGRRIEITGVTHRGLPTLFGGTLHTTTTASQPGIHHQPLSPPPPPTIPLSRPPPPPNNPRGA